MGMSFLPSWSGDFVLAGAGGESMNFDVDGSIANGVLEVGNLNSYNLEAFGSYDESSLSAQDVHGALFGPGLPASDPVNSALVEFDFEHGAAGPRVQGAGGADF